MVVPNRECRLAVVLDLSLELLLSAASKESSRDVSIYYRNIFTVSVANYVPRKGLSQEGGVR